MGNTFVRELKQHVELHRCDRTGIAWVQDGRTGSGHSAHPNIDTTGSVRGMKKLGYWNQKDRIRKTHGYQYNIDKFVASHELDKIAADNCRCDACKERRKHGHND
jgi:hypothetical protein